MAKENNQNPAEQNPAAAPETAAETKSAESAEEAETTETREKAPEQTQQTADAEQKTEAPSAEQTELEKTKAELTREHENYLRLAAEYDNFRKRSQKEKDSLYTEIRSETVSKFLPVYDNLERALGQPTSDEAYKKGVEMTMTGLIDVMGKLGITSFGEVGETFDPAMHNAVMHVEDENLGDNVLAEVFQKGFRVGDKVVRFAMVKVAN